MGAQSIFFAKIFPTITEGSIIEITVTTVEGKVLNSNLKVTREDMEMVEELRKMGEMK